MATEPRAFLTTRDAPPHGSCPCLVMTRTCASGQPDTYHCTACDTALQLPMSEDAFRNATKQASRYAPQPVPLHHKHCGGIARWKAGYDCLACHTPIDAEDVVADTPR